GRAPDSASIRSYVRQRLEDLLADILVALAGQLGIRLLRMFVQGAGHGPDRLIMPQLQWALAAGLLLPAGPGAAERVLQGRKLVRIVPDVVHQPRHEHWRNLR